MFEVAAADSPAEVRDRADAVLDGAADQERLNQLLATHRAVRLLAGGARTTAAVVVPERSLLSGVPGATVHGPRSGAVVDVRGAGSAVRDVTVEGGEVGVVVRASRVDVSRMTVRGSGRDGISTAVGAEHIRLTGNHVVATGRFGITVNGTPARHVTINENLIEGTGAAGLGIVGIGHFVTVADNTTAGTGGDGVAAYNAGNRRVAVVGNTFADPGNHCVHLGGQDLVIANNTGYAPDAHGWFVHNHDGSPARRFVIEGNTVVDLARGVGILIQAARHGSVADNVVDGAHTHAAKIEDGDTVQVVGNTLIGARRGAGLRLHRVNGVTVAGNVIRANSDQGMVVRDYRRGRSRNITVTGNQVLDNGGRSILMVEDTDVVVVTGNLLRGNDGGDEPSLAGSRTVVAHNLVGG